MSRKRMEYSVKSYLNSQIRDIFRENAQKVPKQEPKKGIRETVLETYYTKGILEAYRVLEEYNKRIGIAIYNREALENWIAEEQQKKDMKKDDDGR